QSERPNLVPRQVGPKLEGPLPSNQHSLRKDLHISHNGGKTATENMAHIKFMKILSIRSACHLAGMITCIR
ncbi:hypothetical protein B296_00007204, partial [Ensete ventricosum]